MALSDSFAPAKLWRAFFICTLSVGSLIAGYAAAPTKAPELSQVGLPNPAEAARILDEFRRSGLPGHYYFEFELRSLPRRGDEQTFKGRLWGGRNEQGQISRVELVDAQGAHHRFLVQNGEQAAVWNWAAGKVSRLSVAALFNPLIPGVELTPFDLQMPFLYWPDAKLERITRMRGRPSLGFFFRPPGLFSQQNPDLAGARAYLDTQYHALMQTELIGADGRVQKTLTLVDLKKLGGQWLPKSLDVRNERTRDKTRFLVTAAGLNLTFGPNVFEPASLAEDIRSPASGSIVPLP